MNFAEQIRVFESFDLRNSSKKNEKFKNMPNVKAISRLLVEAEKHNANFASKEMSSSKTSTATTSTPSSNTSRKLETLYEIKPPPSNNRVRLSRLEPLNESKKDVRFSEKSNNVAKKKVKRMNLYGYESIHEEAVQVIRKISPKQKEPRPSLRPPLESLTKKPSLKPSNEKSELKIVKEDTQHNETKIVNEMDILLAKNDQLDQNKETSVTFSSSLSEDANYAMLKTYEDMLYFDLMSIYPETAHLVRTKTKDFIQIKRKMPAKLPAIRGSPEDDNEIISQVKNHKVKISKHLEKVNE